MTSYSVLWRDDETGTAAGSLRLREDDVVLEGLRDGEPVSTRVRWDELRGVRIGRLPHERVNGGASVVLEREGGADLCIEPLARGFLAELADALWRTR